MFYYENMVVPMDRAFIRLPPETYVFQDTAWRQVEPGSLILPIFVPPANLKHEDAERILHDEYGFSRKLERALQWMAVYSARRVIASKTLRSTLLRCPQEDILIVARRELEFGLLAAPSGTMLGTATDPPAGFPEWILDIVREVGRTRVKSAWQRLGAILD